MTTPLVRNSAYMKNKQQKNSWLIGGVLWYAILGVFTVNAEIHKTLRRAVSLCEYFLGKKMFCKNLPT